LFEEKVCKKDSTMKTFNISHRDFLALLRWGLIPSHFIDGWQGGANGGKKVQLSPRFRYSKTFVPFSIFLAALIVFTNSATILQSMILVVIGLLMPLAEYMPYYLTLRRLRRDFIRLFLLWIEIDTFSGREVIIFYLKKFLQIEYSKLSADITASLGRIAMKIIRLQRKAIRGGVSDQSTLLQEAELIKRVRYAPSHRTAANFKIVDETWDVIWTRAEKLVLEEERACAPAGFSSTQLPTTTKPNQPTSTYMMTGVPEEYPS